MSRFYLDAPRSTTSTAGRTSARRTRRSPPTSSPATSASSGIETRFLMGNDEHSQNVFRKATRARARSARLLRSDGAGQFRDVWAKLSISFDDFIRTTEPRHRAAVQKMAQACFDAGDVYEGHYEGWYCVSCESFKQEKDLVDGKCPIHLTTARLDSREELLLPPVAVSAAAPRPLRRPPRVHPAGHPAQRDPPAGRRRPRRHLDQPRRTVVGHPAAVRPDERRLRLVRRADQLRGGGRLWH